MENILKVFSIIIQHMKSDMVKILKSHVPDKQEHSNAGKKWNDEEETLLLEELNKNMGIQLIAKSHNRTTGSINARRRQIAYNLYINNFTMEEIIFKTKLEEDKIMQTIERRQKNPKKCNSITEIKDPDGKMLGAEGFQNYIKKYQSTPNNERLKKIIEDIVKSGKIQKDDLTIVAVDGK